MSNSQLVHRVYPLLVGLLLGLVQTGLFFQLSFTYSSNFRTYVMVVIGWLMGSVVGLRVATKWPIPTNGFLLMALFAYAISSSMLQLRPFETTFGFLYAFLTILIGIYPGVFFARMGTIYQVRQLFFYENNGFIIGLVGATLLFMLVGRLGIWVSPVLVASLVIILGMYGNQYDILPT
ncbi:MAG: hypothetical protein HND46_13155 [Chloroflexi bacterium]|nr:hypothetical protein [Chloroflexota bacterium]